MEDVAGGRNANFDHIVVVPVAIYAYVVCAVHEKIQRGSRRALVLILVLSPGLGSDPLARLDLTKSWISTEHQLLLIRLMGIYSPRPQVFADMRFEVLVAHDRATKTRGDLRRRFNYIFNGLPDALLR